MADRAGLLDTAIESVLKLFVLLILLYIVGDWIWNNLIPF